MLKVVITLPGLNNQKKMHRSMYYEIVRYCDMDPVLSYRSSIYYKKIGFFFLIFTLIIYTTDLEMVRKVNPYSIWINALLT